MPVESQEAGDGPAGPSRPWLTPATALGRFAPAGRLDRTLRAAPHTTVRYGYRVANIGLLVGEHVGCEVVPVPVIVRVPTTPPWLLGVANLRGGLVPIFDLQALLELPARETRPPRFGLIFDRGEQAVGILVADHPVSLQGLQPLPRPPPLPAAARDFVAAALHHGESVWLELDHRRFFTHAAQRMTGISSGEST